MSRDRRSNSSKATPIKKLEPFATDDLAPKVATYGHYCRTASFVNFSYESWMEALQISPGKWVLREVRCEIDMKNTDADIKRGGTEIIASHNTCSFMDALKTLHNFEQSYKENSTHHIELVPAEDLGMDYYVAFGEREGIAFNKKGHPLVTVNGHVLEGDDIDYATMQKVKQAWAEKQLLFMNEAEDMLPHFSLSVDEKALDAFLISLHNRNFITDIRQKFEDCIKSFDTLLEDKHTTHLPSHEYFKKLKKLEDVIDEQFPQGDGFDPLSYSPEYAQVLNRLKQYVAAMELHGRLYIAKESFTRVFNRKNQQNTSPDIARLKGDIITAAKEIKQKYLTLGNEPVTLEQIQAEIIKLNKPFGHVLEVRPKAMRVISTTLDDMQKRSETIAEELRRAALKQEKDKKTPSKNLSGR